MLLPVVVVVVVVVGLVILFKNTAQKHISSSCIAIKTKKLTYRIKPLLYNLADGLAANNGTDTLSPFLPAPLVYFSSKIFLRKFRETILH